MMPPKFETVSPGLNAGGSGAGGTWLSLTLSCHREGISGLGDEEAAAGVGGAAEKERASDGGREGQARFHREAAAGKRQETGHLGLGQGKAPAPALQAQVLGDLGRGGRLALGMARRAVGRAADPDARRPTPRGREGASGGAPRRNRRAAPSGRR